MKVSTEHPFQIVYAVYEHEYLGILFESFVIQLNERGEFTFQYQNISAKNAAEFENGLDEKDYKLIDLIDDMHQDAVIKRFSGKVMKGNEFFPKIYDSEKGKKDIQEAIQLYLEKQRHRILQLLEWKLLFEMAKDGNPTGRALKIMPQKASIRYHFFKNEDNTHYFPTIRYQNQKVDFGYKGAYLLNEEPAWLALEGRVFHFDRLVDGKKLKPFFNKKFIAIPARLEGEYYKKFVAPLIQQFDVQAHGFELRNISSLPIPILEFYEQLEGRTLSLFGEAGNLSGEIIFRLNFKYDDKVFPAHPYYPTSVTVAEQNGSYAFHKYERNKGVENLAKNILFDLGLDLTKGNTKWPLTQAIQWLNSNAQALEKDGIEVRQLDAKGKKYFTGKASIEVEIKESMDWFDIKGLVYFGPYSIPFTDIRRLMKRNQREFTLPNGEVAIIPDAWFAQFADLIQFTEDAEAGEGRLSKIHVGIIAELEQHRLAKVAMDHRLRRLQDFEGMEQYPMPDGFIGTLRPYQYAGYNWLSFLNEYRLGGCLADDMGLGKTIQTLALLQSEKERGIHYPSLLVVPTSLIYNWELEAQKFTPRLTIHIHAGVQRDKDPSKFKDADLIITSYGTLRRDIDFMVGVHFHYVILDESQAIKNPSSIIAKSVRKLMARQRLVLTGTPIENSTLDLWSQMSFVNPGLLGTQTYFRQEFQQPIENQNDEQKRLKLHALIKPFVLRRKKSQVARDLPERIDNLMYCLMTEEQEEAYERVKNQYRDQIMRNIEEQGLNRSHLLIIQGLTQLRQLANHPRMIDPSYEGQSGKLEEVMETLTKVVDEGHKVLIFSQYVKHLKIVREHLEHKGIGYSYLDGSTKNRMEVVQEFGKAAQLPVFLISLKAGGVGLNLTMADYVFILDPWWNPAAEAQAIDRAHRIGQTNTVFSYKFITRGTVEEKILKLQERKLNLAEDLISTEEGFVKQLSADDISQLLS
jgi:superfamily II DNA or RNA helicase